MFDVCSFLVPIISGGNLPDSLAELRRLRLDFAFRERVRFVRPSPITVLKGFNITMGEQLCEIVRIFYGLLACYGHIHI